MGAFDVKCSDWGKLPGVGFGQAVFVEICQLSMDFVPIREHRATVCPPTSRTGLGVWVGLSPITNVWSGVTKIPMSKREENERARDDQLGQKKGPKPALIPADLGRASGVL
jgi:hypothetical protein